MSFVVKYWGVRLNHPQKTAIQQMGDPDIYYDVVDLPDPITFIVLLRIDNNSDQTVYIKITAASLPSADWSFSDVTVGAVNPFSNVYVKVSIQRAKPATLPAPPATLDEQVVLRLEVYSDSNYTNLLGYVDIPLAFHGFDSNDPGWTVLAEANFDDGTMQGWSTVIEYIIGNVGGSCSINGTHYVSPPYSLYCVINTGNSGYVTAFGVSNTVTTTGYTKAFIVGYAAGHGDWTPSQFVGIDIVAGGKRYYIGAPSENLGMSILPNDKWLKAAAPVPIGDNLTVQFRTLLRPTPSYRARSWIDNVKVIAA